MSDATSTQVLTTDQRLAVVLRAVQRLEQSHEQLVGEVAALRGALPAVPGPNVGERLVEGVRGLRADLATSVASLGTERTANNERVMGAVSEVAEELEHVLEGNDALRHELHDLAARSASATQVVEVTAELRRLLDEIEAARRQAGNLQALPASTTTAGDFPDAVARTLRRAASSARELAAGVRARAQGSRWP